MTIGSGLRVTSPVHVHVDEEMPVHVHVKKKAHSKHHTRTSSTPDSRSYNLRSSRAAKGARRSHSPGVSAALRAHSPAVRARSPGASLRSRSPGAGLRGPSPGGTLASRSPGASLRESRSPASPWIPAPGKTTKGSKMPWQGPTHRLELKPQQENIGMHMCDLSTEDEEVVQGQMMQYESKIGDLMSEVGSLKNEVELQRTRREVEEKDDLLETSQRVLEEQEKELYEYRHELDETELENMRLRKSLNCLNKESNAERTEIAIISDERERLMKKLIEVEMDGQQAAQQVEALRETVRTLRHDKSVSATTTQKVAYQKEQLLEKLADFDNTNHTLRRLLREYHQQEAANSRLGEQRDVLMGRLTESDRANEHLRNEILEKEQIIGDLTSQFSSRDEDSRNMRSVTHSLEKTRAHLQKQLKSKEADCNRLCVNIRTLESEIPQLKIENEHLQGLLASAREKADKDKEALKKATRAQKQRALRSEDVVEQLNAQLMERDNALADLEARNEEVRAMLVKTDKEKIQADAENSGLKIRLSELERTIERLEETGRQHSDNLTEQVAEKIDLLATTRLENDKLKSSVYTVEGRIKNTEEEASNLKQNLKQYETLVDEYRTKVNTHRHDADAALTKLEHQQKENEHIRREGDMELEKVKMRLHQRLQELEPLPELLKCSELKFQDAAEQLKMFEHKNVECTKLLSELTAKVEGQSGQMEQTRDKWHDSQDENKVLTSRVDSLERRLKDMEEESRDLATNLAKREETIHQINLRMEDRSRDNQSLTRQLENALDDAKKQSDIARDKGSTKERTYHGRIVDLESQLSHSRTELAKIRRDKEETERKSNSRLYDLKDRLEQSHSTNRSMQNYVQFLKNSYANVFGDTSVMASTPVRSPLL